MGYACPVCETPQVDAKHLANHLAFTALLGDADHETWLDEHAPEWEQADDEALAERIVEDAENAALPGDRVEHDHGTTDLPTNGDRTDRGHTGEGDHPGELAGGGQHTTDDHDPGVTFDDFGGGPTARSDPALDADAKEVLREAYEMTRKRRERAAEAEDGPSESRSDDSNGGHAERDPAREEPADPDADETE